MQVVCTIGISIQKRFVLVNVGLILGLTLSNPFAHSLIRSFAH